MGRLLDSDVLIAVERGIIDLTSLAGDSEEHYFISVITASEILQGAIRAQPESRRIQRAAFVEGVLVRFPILPADIGIARIHAGVYAGLRSRGQAIGIHDSWIAATCLAHELTLITMNARDFSRVSGLSIEEWSPSS